MGIATVSLGRSYLPLSVWGGSRSIELVVASAPESFQPDIELRLRWKLVRVTDESLVILNPEERHHLLFPTSPPACSLQPLTRILLLQTWTSRRVKYTPSPCVHWHTVAPACARNWNSGQNRGPPSSRCEVRLWVTNPLDALDMRVSHHVCSLDGASLVSLCGLEIKPLVRLGHTLIVAIVERDTRLEPMGLFFLPSGVSNFEKRERNK